MSPAEAAATRAEPDASTAALRAAICASRSWASCSDLARCDRAASSARASSSAACTVSYLRCTSLARDDPLRGGRLEPTGPAAQRVGARRAGRRPGGAGRHETLDVLHPGECLGRTRGGQDRGVERRTPRHVERAHPLVLVGAGGGLGPVGQVGVLRGTDAPGDAARQVPQRPVVGTQRALDAGLQRDHPVGGRCDLGPRVVQALGLGRRGADDRGQQHDRRQGSRASQTTVSATHTCYVGAWRGCLDVVRRHASTPCEDRPVRCRVRDGCAG